jgi:hypothetical protein
MDQYLFNSKSIWRFRGWRDGALSGDAEATREAGGHSRCWLGTANGLLCPIDGQK